MVKQAKLLLFSTVGVEFIYLLGLLPIQNVAQAFDDVVVGFFDEHFHNSEEMDNFVHYVERTYMEKQLRRGGRGRPIFPIEMWSNRESVLGDQQTTNNAVKSWNARWNKW